jgi:hypothetical protein
MILSGWKEIAQYLHCGVRTVQRWEGDGLPVHRPSPHKRSHVIAHSEELDRWIKTGRAHGTDYPKLSASLTMAQKLRLENKARMVELRASLFRLRQRLQELRAHRTRNLRAGQTAVHPVTEQRPN